MRSMLRTKASGSSSVNPKKKLSKGRPRRSEYDKLGRCEKRGHLLSKSYSFCDETSDVSDNELSNEGSYELSEVRSRSGNSSSNALTLTKSSDEIVEETGGQLIKNDHFVIKPYTDVVQDWDIFEHVIQAGDTLQSLSLKYSIPVSEIKRVNKLIIDQDFFALRTAKILVRKHGILSELLLDKENKTENVNESSAASSGRTIHLGIGNKINGIADNSVKNFFQEMDNDIEKIMQSSKTCKDSLEEVTSTLTCTRFTPIIDSKKFNGDKFRLFTAILIIVIVAIIVPVMYYFYASTTENKIKS